MLGTKRKRFENLTDVLDLLTSKESLDIASQEVNEEASKKQRSTMVMQTFHEFAEDCVSDRSDMKCGNEKDFLISLLQHSDKAVALAAIPKIQQLLTTLYRNPRTRTVYSKEIRDVYKKFGDDAYQEACKVIHISAQERKDIAAEYEKKVYNMHCNQIKISKEKILELITENKASSDWRLLTILVGVATGARLIEILMVSKFSPLEDSPYIITITGVAKTKDLREITKPTFGLSGEEIVNAVSRIRKTLSVERKWDLGVGTSGKVMTRQQVTHSVTKGIQNRVKKIFGSTATFHKLRSIYAEFSYLTYLASCKNQPVSKTAYFSYVLGHRPESLHTALSYERYNVQQ